VNIEIDFKISESATKEFKKALGESADQESLVRVSVQSGCSGSAYGLGFVSASDVNPSVDIVGEYDGVKVVVDRTSLLALDGITVDWVDDSGQIGFKFMSKSTCNKQCGCSRKK
jgi:iron-sulfur cluster assembly protein